MKQNDLSTTASLTSVALPSLAILLSQFFELAVFINTPDAKRGLLVFTWVVAQVVGSMVVGAASDLFGRKNTFIFTQLIGCLGYALAYACSFNLWILSITALFYSPIPVAKAALVDHLQKFTLRAVFSCTVILQAIPWAFYTLVERAQVGTVFTATIIFGLLVALLSHAFYHNAPREELPRRTDLTSMQFPRISKLLISFCLAEIVYFLIAMPTETQFIVNKGDLFIVIAVSVSLGSAIHLLTMSLKRKIYNSILLSTYVLGGTVALTLLLTTLFIWPEKLTLLLTALLCCFGALFVPFVLVAIKWHPKVYGWAAGSIYALGAVLMLMLIITNCIFSPEGFSIFFISIVSCLGGLYIPFVFALITRNFQAHNRGLSCGLGGSTQGVASVMAPLLLYVAGGRFLYLEFILALLFLGATLTLAFKWRKWRLFGTSTPPQEGNIINISDFMLGGL